MLFLISGAAATGKTTTVKILNDRLENFECHDFDETPVNDGTSRRVVNEDWIKKALEAQKQGKDFLLSSHSPLVKFWLVLLQLNWMVSNAVCWIVTIL